MKTNTIIQSTIAALALAFIPNSPAQTPAASAKDSSAAGKGAAPAPAKSLREEIPLLKRATEAIAPPAPAGPRDPYATGKAAAAPAPDPVPAAESAENLNVSVAYEAFSLPVAKAGEIQRKGMSDSELYKELVTTGKLERMLVLRGKPGQRAVLENVTEYRFATEFTPAQAGDAVEHPKAADDGAKKEDFATAANKAKVHRQGTPVTPTAFETRNVGDSLEVEPVLSPDAKIVDLNVSITHTALVGRDKWGQGISEVEQPQFETQKAVTNASLTIGSPFLIGTLNPVFGNGVTQRAEQNVWFCFITPTLTRASGDSAKKSAH